MDIQQAFGNNIRRCRMIKGWTQEALSEKTGLHRTYISGLERGVRNPSLEIIQNIAHTLDIEASVLLQFQMDQK